MKPIAGAFALNIFSVSAIQNSRLWEREASLARSSEKDKAGGESMSFIMLNETESSERGAVCMDGSTPGFYYKAASTSAKKWILAFEGGGFCEDTSQCQELTTGYTSPNADGVASSADLNIFYADEFKGYNQVVFHHCDFGLYSSEREAPVTSGSTKMYFRGKRILDHVIDTLKKEKDLDSATDVLLVGGSGGGQSVFIAADYIKGQMPASVQKFGALPMDGWYPYEGADGSSGKGAQQEGIYVLHNMSGTIPPECAKQLGSVDEWKCMASDIAYTYSYTPMFVIQLLDYQGATAYDLDEDHMSDWSNCMADYATANSACTNESISRLQGFVDSVASSLQTKKVAGTYNGGFVSTCTTHTFYLTTEEGYFHFGSDGVTIENAVLDWWKNLGTKSGKYYLPCTLNEEYPYQCEASCS